MESLAHMNVLLAVYGGVFLGRSVPRVLWLINEVGVVSLIPVEFRVLAVALCACGVALVLLPLVCVRAAHAARAPRRALHITYACAMAVLLVGEAALLGWLAHRGFDHLMVSALSLTMLWILIGLLALLLLLQLGALLLSAQLARRATSPGTRRVTSSTAWKPM